MKSRIKVKRMTRTEHSLRDIWDNIKPINIQIIVVSEEKEKKKGYEKIFEEIIVENFLSMEKEIVSQVQEAQRVPYRINPRRNTPRHILIKLTNIKHRKNIKSSKEKATISVQESPHKVNSWSFCRNSAGQKEVAGYIWGTEGKICKQDYCTQQGFHSKLMEK